MELLFESRLELTAVNGKVHAFQARPRLHSEPVVLPDSPGDAGGASIYGSVLQDSGRFRMWYQGWPREWGGGNSAIVCYAESEDGVSWVKPKLNMVNLGDGPSNICNLGFHAPSVFIDPEAPASHRYRATGYSAKHYQTAPEEVTVGGYYTAHSADGLDWQLDSDRPTWSGADVITSIYHPTQRRGIVAMKHRPFVGNIPRRAVYTATLENSVWSDEVCALVPDAWDDACALARGYASGDYYGMGMAPAGEGTVGFLWQFRHTLPRTQGSEQGVFGVVDVSLVWQGGPGERWLHTASREDWLSHGAVPWATGGMYTASCPILARDEQRLYFSGAMHSHGWYVDNQWQVVDKWKQQMIEEGFGRIGYCWWPKDRFFGFRADPAGSIDLNLGEITNPCELVLNLKTSSAGSVRVELVDREGHSFEEAVPVTGDVLEEPIHWKGGNTIQPEPGKPLHVRIHMEDAEVYAYALRPLRP